MASILVELPADRTRLGRISLLDDKAVRRFGPAPCFGKADSAGAAEHGNPSRNPLLPWGDTPLGVYDATVARVTVTPEVERKYGPNGFLTLRPKGGDAKIAEANGRFGLLIHGGAPGPRGGLRPTFGCVRVGNDDLKALIAAVPESPLECRIVEAA